MRKHIVAGNWKMNLTEQESIELAKEVAEMRVENTEIVIFPPAIFIPTLSKLNLNLKIGAQNFFPKDNGAFTGEISINQLKEAGVTYVLVGHSERRTICHCLYTRTGINGFIAGRKFICQIDGDWFGNSVDCR